MEELQLVRREKEHAANHLKAEEEENKQKIENVNACNSEIEALQV